ncbi:MAG: type II toxin-antitoxin system RelE/ParE family toxin [Bacteroidota bacterium]
MEKIEWSELALSDLQSIHEYISRDSAFYANKLISKIAGRIDQLEKFQQSGRIVPELNNEMVRELIEGSYRIIYQVEDGCVTIVRIHHSAMILKKLR